ncbi:MAG: hypothetical protein J6V07_06785, partial [Clostridia bacterium]|nr:hypothetical protein [Clostridia bacterium]
DEGSVTIVTADGDNVLGNYTVTFNKGSLTIKPLDITLTSGDKEKVYDGTPLTHHMIDGKATGLIEGHTVTSGLDFTGSIVNVKDNEPGNNTFDNKGAKITDAEGNDVTENYNVTGTKSGTLVVKPRPVTVTLKGDTWTYDGEAHSETKTSNITGLVDGHKLQVTKSTAVTNYTEKPVLNVAEKFLVEDANGEPIDAENYAIETDLAKTGTLTINKRPITIKTPDGTWKFAARMHKTALTYELKEDEGRLVEDHTLTVLELTEVAFVVRDEKGEVTWVPNELRKYDIKDGETSVKENYEVKVEPGQLTVTPFKITGSTADLSFLYDADYHSATEEDVEITSKLPGGHRLVYGEFTKLLDVVRDKEGKPTSVENEFGLNSSWRVFSTNDEDYTTNYELEIEWGTLTVKPRPITLTSATDQKDYDGTPLTKPEFARGTLNTLCGDHRIVGYEFDDEASVTEPGTVNNTFRRIDGEFAIVDAAGTDVTANYEIAAEDVFGTLTVAEKTITLRTLDLVSFYTGKAISYPQFEVRLNNGKWIPYFTADDLIGTELEGITIVTDGWTEKTEIGRYYNLYESIKILMDEEDITVNYSIVCSSTGVLEILERRITVSAESATGKIGDYTEETPLTRPECFEVTGEDGKSALLEGHEIDLDSVKFTGSLWTLGWCDNKIVKGTLRILNEEGVDVTHLYDITLRPGELTIVGEIPLYLRPINISKEYDGTPIDPLALRPDVTDDLRFLDKASRDFLLNMGYTVVGTPTVSSEALTNVGTEESRISLKGVRILNADGEDITDLCYIPKKDAEGNRLIGTLTVTPKELTFTTPTMSWVYDGEEHSATEEMKATIEEIVKGLLDGHTFHLLTSTSLVNAGTQPNAITSFMITDAEGNDVTDKYRKAVTHYGNLEITPAPLFITLGATTAVYDGKKDPYDPPEKVLKCALDGVTIDVTKALYAIYEFPSTTDKNVTRISVSSREITQGDLVYTITRNGNEELKGNYTVYVVANVSGESLE